MCSLSVEYPRWEPQWWEGDAAAFSSYRWSYPVGASLLKMQTRLIDIFMPPSQDVELLKQKHLLSSLVSTSGYVCTKKALRKRL